MFYFVGPEVAGGLGDNTVMDTSYHPPVVSELEYQFDGWLGDEILEIFPCFIVTKSLAALFVKHKLSGFALEKVKISKSEQFNDVYPDVGLPEFFWLKVVGSAGIDDFGLSDDYRLVVSDSTVSLFGKAKVNNAEFENFR